MRWHRGMIFFRGNYRNYIENIFLYLFSYVQSIRGIFMGYSWGIHGVFICIGYVSVMCRLCIGYVSVYAWRGWVLIQISCNVFLSNTF